MADDTLDTAAMAADGRLYIIDEKGVIRAKGSLGEGVIARVADVLTGKVSPSGRTPGSATLASRTGAP